MIYIYLFIFLTYIFNEYINVNMVRNLNLFSPIITNYLFTINTKLFHLFTNDLYSYLFIYLLIIILFFNTIYLSIIIPILHFSLLMLLFSIYITFNSNINVFYLLLFICLSINIFYLSITVFL